MPAPVLLAIDQTSLRVVWSAPNRPNGRIITYNLYLDGRKIETGQALPGSYVLRNLQPYTVYNIEAGCLSYLVHIISSITAVLFLH